MLTATQRTQFRSFREGYIECRLWAEYLIGGSDEEDNLRTAFDIDQLDYSCVAKDAGWMYDLRACVAFFADNYADLCEASEDFSQHGHDFHLTRNGHGAGFWDRGYGETGLRLSDACKPWGGTHSFLDGDTIRWGG